jgi:hypothetical protein
MFIEYETVQDMAQELVQSTNSVPYGIKVFRKVGVLSQLSLHTDNS